VLQDGWQSLSEFLQPRAFDLIPLKSKGEIGSLQIACRHLRLGPFNCSKEERSSLFKLNPSDRLSAPAPTGCLLIQREVGQAESESYAYRREEPAGPIDWQRDRFGQGSIPSAGGIEAKQASLICSPQQIIDRLTELSDVAQGSGPVVPDPSSLALLGSGLLALGGRARRKFNL
jgi:hypothetical protein